MADNCMRSSPVESLEHRLEQHITFENVTIRLITLIKTILYSILCLLSRLSPRRYVPILVYHSVDKNSSFFTVTPDEFEKHMAYLSRNYSIVSLEEVFEFLMGKRDLPRKSVALTFDDGYYDNYANVYPCVKKYRFPIAIFLVSGCIGKEMALDNVPLRMLGWEEIREMSNHNVTIGAHTSTHPDLRSIGISEAMDQIQTSKTDIEGVLGKPVDFFAYPKGAYNSTLVTLLRPSGFKAAFGGRFDGGVRRGDNPFVLKRVSVDASVNFLTFVAKLTIATEWYRQLEKSAARLVRRLRFLTDISVIYNKR